MEKLFHLLFFSLFTDLASEQEETHHNINGFNAEFLTIEFF